MSRITRTAALLSIAVPLTLLAACGDDDNAIQTDNVTEAAPDARLSRASWISTVNEMCTEHNDALAQVIGPLFAAGPPTDEAAQAAADEIIRRTRSVTGQIDALNEPSSLTIHVAALVAALDAGSDEVEALGGPAFFATNRDPYRHAADIAGELGLDACDTEA